MINQTRIKAVYNGLSDLKDKVVFVGGSTVSFYSDTPQLEARPTDDIDIVVEIITYADQQKIDEQLRSIGFRNDTTSGVICRYLYEGIIVDVLPTSGEHLGFRTRWYQEGFENSTIFEIDPAHKIRILSTPYFLATKFEAFKDRGKNDGRTSQDFEDIIYILEHRKRIWLEISELSGEIKKYLLAEFKSLKSHPGLREWIESHVERIATPATNFILENIEKLINKSET